MDPVSVTSARQRMEMDRRPRRRPDRGILPIALLISAALHVLVLSLRFDVPVTPRDIAFIPGVIGNGTAPAMRVYDIVAVEYAAPLPRAEVVQRQDVELRLAMVTEFTGALRDDRLGLSPPASGAARASIAERIAPRSGDARLWNPVRPDFRPVDMLHARLYAEIASYNDSTAATIEAARRATDWTHTDENGGRWGVSPGAIHLGKVTLSPCERLVVIISPFTCEFRVPPGRRGQHADRLRSFNEIRQQRIRLGPTESIQQRIRAIRVRTDAKRDSTARVPH